MTEPLVSVLMPTYNGERYVAEAIDSALAQTYDRLELVVVDDASSDGTAKIVEAYVRRHPDRVQFARKTSRRGPCERRNDALDLAQGTLLAWLDQDDLWLPEKLERQVEVFEKNPDVGLVYTGYEAFNSETGVVIDDWRDETIEAVGDVLVPLFYEGSFIASVTAAFRREALERRGVRLRDKDFSFGDDYYLWLTIALDWHVARVDDVLARYRRHTDNETQKVAQTNFHLKRLELLDEFVAEFPEARRRLGAWRRRGLRNHLLYAASFEYQRNVLSKAVWYGLRALAIDPAGSMRAMATLLRRRMDGRRLDAAGATEA
jgi:glycosyltransferase involved in cell wall biosynthesis